MTAEEINARYIEHATRLARLDDVGTPLGSLFRSIRQAAQIPADEFAELFGISPQILDDIESGRRPFPTMFLMCIFSYGIPAWFNGDGE